MKNVNVMFNGSEISMVLSDDDARIFSNNYARRQQYRPAMVANSGRGYKDQVSGKTSIFYYIDITAYQIEEVVTENKKVADPSQGVEAPVEQSEQPKQTRTRRKIQSTGGEDSGSQEES